MNWRDLQTFYRNRQLISFLLLTIISLALCYYYANIISISHHFANKGDIRKIEHFHMSEAEILQKAQQSATNFPILFWEANKDQNLYYKNKSCARFPNVYELKVNNLYWQLLRTTKATYYLFGAYYDVRKHCSICPAVRLLGHIDSQGIKGYTFCQIWFADSNEPLIVKSTEYVFYNRKDSLTSYPNLVTCSIPREFSGRVPIFVSLVENMCDNATNSLRVIFNKPDNTEKAGFAVCAKLLDYLHDDQSLRLIEWIELLRLVGADKIIVSSLSIHENIVKVLRYYEEQGLVDWTPTTLVGDAVHLPYFQHLQFYQKTYKERKVSNEVVQINDCFYKNMYKYNYITMLDTDEVIMPHKAYNWKGLMESVLKHVSSSKKPCAFHTAMVMFPSCDNQTDTIMCHMLQHIICTRERVNPNPKTFFDTERIEVAMNHKPKKDLTMRRLSYWFDRRDAELFHYRNAPYGKNGSKWDCEELVRKNEVDTTIWKYKEQLINRTMATFNNLGFNC